MKTIAIYLFPDVEELDAVGPWEVLAFWTNRYDADGYRVTTFSDDGRPVRCAKGLTVVPHTSRADLGEIDTLIYPGGRGANRLTTDQDHLAWVRGLRSEVPLLTSVCTGALVLAAAGLLRDRPATTHWGSLDDLTALDPSIELRPDARYVDSGDVITAAGVSAGIDMALHLVHRFAGPERSAWVRRGIQYEPAPPR
jgi:transcriptional regulator GlxA family with amidase domain